MRKNLKIALLIISIIIVGGGVTFGIIFVVTWGEYEYSNTYYYEPSVIPSEIEMVDFHSDVGNIIINYNTTPTNHFVELALDIRLKGAFVEGKSFSDFFKQIIWLNESGSVITFSLKKKSYLLPIIQKININIILRTDIIYDIVADTNTGSVEMYIPNYIKLNNTNLESSTGSISIHADKQSIFYGNLNLRTSTGNIELFAKDVNFSHGLSMHGSTGSLVLNFTNCIIGDDITGSISTGSISIKSYNMLFTQDCTWVFGTSTGSINLDIFQYIDMGANVSGSLGTSTGNVDLIYIDNQPSVGASFLGVGLQVVICDLAAVVVLAQRSIIHFNLSIMK